MIKKANRGLLDTLLNEPFTFLGGLLFFLMMFSPSYNVVFKIILIFILIVTIVSTRIIFDKLNITGEVLIWYAVFIGHGIFFTILGFLYRNNSNYILHSTTYNIIWPVVYLIFTIGLYKKTSFDFLIKTIIISNLLISLYLIGSTLTNFGFLPPLPFITFEMSHFDIDPLQGLIKTQTPSVVTLLFTVPFITALILLDNKKTFGFSKTFLGVTLLISIIAILTTARRALILNVFLGYILTLIYSRNARVTTKKIIKRNSRRLLIGGAVLLLIVFIIIQQLGFLDLVLVYEKFTSAFSSRENLSDISTETRYDQFDLLIKSWLQEPFLGHGHAAVSPYVVRNETNPWIYELSYVALLFQTGIIGLFVFLLLLAWPIIRGLQLVKTTSENMGIYIIPSIVGCTCFLIANGTNPYLSSYDYIWALFFPIAIINYAIKEVNG